MQYVDIEALEHIFGAKFPTTMGRGLTDYSRIEWRRAIQSLPRKDITVDSAFLSASTNEAQNVFYSQYGVKLKIEVPPGTPMYLTDNYVESEIVLGRGTKLEFIGVSVEDMRNEWGTKFSHVTIRCRIKR